MTTIYTQQAPALWMVKGWQPSFGRTHSAGMREIRSNRCRHSNGRAYQKITTIPRLTACPDWPYKASPGSASKGIADAQALFGDTKWNLEASQTFP